MSFRPRLRLGSRLRWLAGRARRHRRSISGCCVMLAGILGFLVNWTQAPQTLCTLPGVHSLCRSKGWGGVATIAEEELWAKAKARRDGGGLRAYLARYPAGAFAGTAQARLGGCRRIIAQRWVEESRSLPLYAAVDAPGGAAALQRLAAEEAKYVCRGYDQGEFRVRLASASVRRSSCADGRCEIEGDAICQVGVRHQTWREECAPAP